jgi:hypothetical protein
MHLHPGLSPKILSSIIANTYAVQIRNVDQLRVIERFPVRVLIAAIEEVDHFQPIVAREMGALLRLLRVVDPAILWSLRQVNTAFQITLTEFPARVPVQRWVAFGNACSRVAAGDRPYLNRFYESKANRPRDNQITSTEEIFHTANVVGLGAQALGVMRSTAEYSTDEHRSTDGVTSRSIVALARMWHHYPPMSMFMVGFAVWGPGDSRSTGAVNLERHCEKHVLYQDVGPLYGVREPTQWWGLLDLNLTLADYEQHVRAPLLQVRNLFDGNRPLRGENVKKLLLYHGGLRSEPDLTRFLKNQALPRYRDFAILRSRGMDNAIVQSDGESVFISGSSGPAFIIGRFDGVQLGISSCYLPEPLDVKLRGARAVRAWPLR